MITINVAIKKKVKDQKHGVEKKEQNIKLSDNMWLFLHKSNIGSIITDIWFTIKTDRQHLIES